MLGSTGFLTVGIGRNHCVEMMAVISSVQLVLFTLLLLIMPLKINNRLTLMLVCVCVLCDPFDVCATAI